MAGFTVTTGASRTVMMELARLVVSVAESAVTTAVPTPVPVTTPLLSTAAMAVLLERQRVAVEAPLSALTVATSWRV